MTSHYYEITQAIKDQLNKDLFVNTVTIGDIFKVDLNKLTIFPLSHIIINSATYLGSTWNYNVWLYHHVLYHHSFMSKEQDPDIHNYMPLYSKSL
jgi:hypothetical protein